ncbi:MAG: ATP-binding cassette domain-containing protein [Lachnospiraceae bacterium]|nr:ATP-binding cassette domain-containing protein [Lachnospiraceae bacterium]
MKSINIKPRYIVVSVLSALACMVNAGGTYYLSRVIEEPDIPNFTKMSIFLAGSILIAPAVSLLVSSFAAKDQYEHKERLIKAAVQKRMLFVESERYDHQVNFLKSNSQEREILSLIQKVSEAGACLLALMLLLSIYLKWYLVVLDGAVYIAVAVILIQPTLKLARLMSDFWVNYIRNTRYYNYISDVLSRKEYVEEKKIYSFFGYFVNIFDLEFRKASEINKDLGKKRIRLEEKNDLINSVFILFQMLFLAILCVRDLISVSFFVAVLPFAIMTCSKVCIAVNGLNSLSQAERYLAEEKAFLAIEQKEATQYKEMEYALHLNGISFAYPNTERLILDNISFDFKKGKKYAIVGINGCGKTTLAKVISGLYEPQTGSVTSAGEIAILFQDFVRYPFTVGENVALQTEYDADRINRILELLGMTAAIENMKKGLASELTNTKADGVSLSGGQWQRLALARILYLSNDIVILDEPTASLDPQIEIELYREYMKCFSDQTVIFITHRLGYIRDVDEILVLKDGKITEHGTPVDLLHDKTTFFHQLFEEQRSLYET